jgi:site-specific recombinase XerD
MRAIEKHENQNLDSLKRRASTLAANAIAGSTKRKYQSHTKHFGNWCRKHNLISLPATPETIALYLTDRANEGCKVSTLSQAMAAIKAAHELTDHENPCDSKKLKIVWQGIRRELGVAQDQKAPLLISDLKKILENIPHTLTGIRNKAILLIGFSGAFRRSEVVSLKTSDLMWTNEGLMILLRRSKTDQDGAGRQIAIPYGKNANCCPVLALKNWLEKSQIKGGSIFRKIDRHGNISEKPLTDQSVALVLKQCASSVGIDPSKLSGHSLRAGLVTEAAKAGKSPYVIMNQTGHKSVEMVMRYVREANLFENNASSGLGL